MRTSYSALETYKLCPQKFRFQELDRIPAKKSTATVFGTHIHGVLKFMFTKNPLFPTLDEVLDYFRENFPSSDTFSASPEERALFHAEGERMLKLFYRKNAPWNANVVDLEVPFQVLLEDQASGVTHVLAGRMDRIDRAGEGYEIIDYKTSRRIPSQDETDRNLQLSIYALGLTRRWPHVKPKDIALSLHFVRHGEKLATRRTAEALERTREDVVSTISEIEAKIRSDDRFDPVPGGYCSSCPYQKICPAWRHLFRDRANPPPGEAEAEKLLAEYFEIAKQEKQNTARLREIKSRLADYMASSNLDRLFYDDGYLALTRQKRYGYDFAKVKAVLEPLGKWDEILSADDKRLKALLPSLPPEARAAIARAKTITREFTSLGASMKKIKEPGAREKRVEKETPESNGAHPAEPGKPAGRL